MEIEFRAWDGKRMVYLNKNDPDFQGGWFRLYPDGSWEISDKDDFQTCENEWLIDSIKSEEKGILMQFTGLKDKNGKKIFEGDILDSNGDFEENHHVRWATIEVHGMYTSTFYSGWNIQVKSDEFEKVDSSIIGNIYENPELLK